MKTKKTYAKKIINGKFRKLNSRKKTYKAIFAKQNICDCASGQATKSSKKVQRRVELSNEYSKPKKAGAKVLCAVEFDAIVDSWKTNTNNVPKTAHATKEKSKLNSRKAVGSQLQIMILIPNMTPSALIRLFRRQSNVIFEMPLEKTTIQSESNLRKVRKQVLKALDAQLKQAKAQVENCDTYKR